VTKRLWLLIHQYQTNRGARRASITRLASATISSVRLFSRLEGLSANARVEPGEKIDALQPFPIGLTSIRYPLYPIAVIASARKRLDGPGLREWEATQNSRMPVEVKRCRTCHHRSRMSVEDVPTNKSKDPSRGHPARVLYAWHAYRKGAWGLWELEAARHLLTLRRIAFGICIKQLTLNGLWKSGITPHVGKTKQAGTKAIACRPK
jgi:hypothetical protein